MKILGITGRAGSGKTTLSNQLEEYGWHKTHFASPIKSMIVTLLLYQGVDNTLALRMVDGDLKEVPTQFLNGCTPRHAMQTLGTEWRNLIHRDLWIDIWHRKIINYSLGTRIVVDDIRFKYEVDILIGLGAKLIRIERPSNTTTRMAHISETEIAEILVNGIIINDTTPENMLSQLKTIIGDL